MDAGSTGDRYRTLIDATSDVISSLDRNGRVTFVNRAAAELHGYEPEEIVGRHFSDFLPTTELRQAAVEIFERIKASSSPIDYEGKLLRKSGELRDVTVSAVPIRDATGTVIAVVSSVSDVTERRRAERALRASEERYGALLRNLPDTVVALYDRELKLLSIEGPAVTSGKLRREDHEGRLLSELLEPQRFRRVEPYFRRALEGEPGAFEYTTGVGRRIYQVDIGPLTLGSGEISGVFSVSRNITERRQAELRLQKSEALLAEAQRITHIGSWEWDISADEITWSEELYRVYGLTREGFEASFEGYLERVHPDDRERVQGMIERVLRDKRPFHFHHRLIRPDGEVRMMEAHGDVVQDEHGNAARMHGTGQDVTERWRAEEQLALASELALGIADVDTVEEALALALRKICERAGWDLGEAWLPSVDGRRFEYSRARFAISDELHELVDAGEELSVEPGEGLVGKVWQEREAAWISDVRKEPSFMRTREAQGLGLASAMAVPVPAGDELVAVMLFFTREARPKDERLLELVSAVATQIGVLIQRKRTDDSLRRSELMLSQAQRVAHVGSWEWDIVANQISLSDELYRIGGMEPGTFHASYEEALERVHPDDRARVDELMRQAFVDRQPYELDLRSLRREGGHRIVHCHGEVLIDEAGDPVKVVGTAQDVTEQRRLEEESSRFWEMSLDPLAIGDFEGRFRRVNPAFKRLLGFSERELLAMPYPDVIAPDERDRFVAAVQRLGDTGGERSDFDTRIICKDGSVRSVLISAKASRGSGMIYTVTKDITERKGAEEALREAHVELTRRTTELEQSNLELEQFAYDASHDLGEPLRMMSQVADRLGRQYEERLGEDGKRLITSIVDGAERMQMLINDLLEFSRIARQPLEREPVDCNVLLEEALELFAETIREKGAQVTRDPMPTVEAHPLQLGQVFQNLISNALKFTDGTPLRVHVGAQRDADAWHFQVADNGIGVDPGQSERVFEMFRRLHPTDVYAGTGLGLSICKRVIERHGGRIWVEPADPGGSVFHFTIPELPTGEVPG